MAFDLGGLLQQYLGGVGGQGAANVTEHYEQVAQNVPPEALSHGLAAAFHSEQTPPFADMVAHLFSQGTPQQQAGMLGQLLSSLAPGALAALGNSGALKGLTGLGVSPGAAPLTPGQISQVTPDQVKAIAEHAQQTSPGVVEKMSGFCAEHPGLVKTLGSAAMAIALAKIADRMKA